jgi:hypothetical protein
MEKMPIFSKEGYIEVIQNALDKGYLFIGFSQKDSIQKGIKYCLMRHDIDISLKCALEMAEIEYALGIKANYFFMLRSPAYNLFTRYAFDVLKKISNMGHEIALHFDAAHPVINSNNLIEKVGEESRILSDLCEQKLYAVSFHQPSSYILTEDIYIPNLINTYNRKQMAEWYYTSDSNRVWKEHTAFSVIDCDHYTKIQLLTHPIWWIYDDVLVEDAWDHAIIDNFYLMQDQFLATERAYGNSRTLDLHRTD